MSSEKLFLSKDILTVFGLDRRVSEHLNKRWKILCDKVDLKCSVPYEDRDCIYYTELTFLKHEIIDFKVLVDSFQMCSLISTSKCVDVSHKADDLISFMEKECVYGSW